MSSDSFEIRRDYRKLVKKIKDDFGLTSNEICDALGITGRTFSSYLSLKEDRPIPVKQIKALQYFHAYLNQERGQIGGLISEISKFLQKKKKDINRCQASDIEKKEFLIKIQLMEEILEK